MFLKYIYLNIILEKLFSFADENDDQKLNKDEFMKSHFIFEKLGLDHLSFEDIYSDQPGQITIDEIINSVISKLEIHDQPTIHQDTHTHNEINVQQDQFTVQEDKDNNPIYEPEVVANTIANIIDFKNDINLLLVDQKIHNISC